MSEKPEGVTVLVVDDEATVCRSIEKILGRGGYRVLSAASVAEALDVLEANRSVSLVLADLMMPGISGMEFVRMVADRWPALPVVVITGYASVASAVEATRLGAVDYLAKPFTIEELVATVKSALLQRRRSRPAAPMAPPAPSPSSPTSPALAEVGSGPVDVDLPFDAQELARATSPEFVARLTRSDVTIVDFCALGQRRCKRVVTRGVCTTPECPVVAASRRRGQARPALELADDLIDVDLPFSAREVAAVTGEAYVRALGRSDLPQAGRWPAEASRRRRVLAVDDEAVVVRAVRRSLEGRRYQVDEAFSGHAALSRVATQVYDLVLLDMRMPDLDGLELLPRIKQYQPDLPVIIVTGYASIDTAVEAIRKGAADYLAKPFTPEELRRAADRILQRVA